jgi:4-alpha-glucanotransferase
MKFIEKNHYQTGISIHLTSIPGKNSCGCGEFEDLINLAEWCEATGLSIIQILPVHDTDENPSPYSAVNAFALNPVYMRLTSVNGHEPFLEQIIEFTKAHSAENKIPYRDIYQFKVLILREIFLSRKNSILNDHDLFRWISENDWVKYFSGYKILARINNTPIWRNWKFDPVFASENIYDNLEKLLHDKNDEFYFLSFIQFELEKQLKKTSERLSKMGINLKGDLPVLMDRESSDVWFHRELFNTGFSAGAPPDQFSEKGQNWGFPVYDIKKLNETNFHWWKERIRHLDTFFHALRLDHVIGYMRIWQVDNENDNAGSGYFSPACYLTKKTCETFGFSETDVDMLATPMTSSHNLQQNFSLDMFEHLKSSLLVPKADGYYALHENLKTEKTIDSLPEQGQVVDFLKNIFLNRSLIEIAPGHYAPKWYFDHCDFFHSMPYEKQDNFRRLVHDYYKKSEKIWESTGTTFLSAIDNASSFLLCGEDLGAVPEITGELLGNLGIMSLKVLRWTRKYGTPGDPFIELDKYPEKSVATTSVHDSDNIRQWWHDDHDARNQLYPLLANRNNTEENNQIQPPDSLDENTASKLIEWFMDCSSQIIIVPIQDFFSVYSRFRIENPEEERINIPGKILDTNWNYKIPVLLEDLTSDLDFQKVVSNLVKTRLPGKHGDNPPKTTSPDRD